MREDLDIDVLVHGEPEVGAALIWVKPSNIILYYDGSILFVLSISAEK